MNCPKCSDPMVTARATNFGEDYWYCKLCKKELAELVALEEKPASLTTSCRALEAFGKHLWAAAEDRCTECGVSGLEYYYSRPPAASPPAPQPPPTPKPPADLFLCLIVAINKFTADTGAPPVNAWMSDRNYAILQSRPLSPGYQTSAGPGYLTITGVPIYPNPSVPDALVDFTGAHGLSTYPLT